ncbi:MAG TPA: tetratricopeptide repeat protein, partial [Methanomicrobiales archaeon]|nr:tetratricopeptide repeat protein [Methanomicrobiales archaeon]
RLEEAGALLCRGLEIYPESVELLKELGVLYHLQGRYGKAARTFTRVMNITGEGTQSLSWRIASLYHKALAELAGPDPGESLLTFDQILALEPGDREALAGRCAALRVLGRTGEAWRCVEEGLALDPPGASIAYQEGWLDMEGDRPDLAEDAFRRSALADPSWPDPVFSRGFALVRLGKGREAGLLLRDSVESAGSSPSLRAMLGWFSLALHDPRSAKDIFMELAREEDLAGYHGLAAALLALGQVAGAREILGRLAAALPRDPLVQVNLGMVLARGPGSRDLADAAIAARRALALSPGFGPAHGCLGIVSLREGDPAAAEAHLTEALRLMDPAAERNLGLFLSMAGRRDEAEARLLRATRLDPLDARAWAGLGAIALRRGETERALGHLRQAYLLDPRDPGTVKGLALAGNKAREEAEQLIRGALPLVPDTARGGLLLELAALLLSGGGPAGDPVLDDEAGEALAAAEKIRPADPGIPFYRGVIAGRRDHPGEAVDLFTSCLESAELHAPAHENIRRLRKYAVAGKGSPSALLSVRTVLASLALIQLAAAWYLFVARLVSETGFLLLLALFSALFALVAFVPRKDRGEKKETPPDLILPLRTFLPVPEADLVSPLLRLRTALRPKKGSGFLP